ncbi:MAG: zinc-binding alcohol dehydrogenase family protein [Acidobacteriota bacterium]|nr:zinc-binding alcohol dehydrogenase family protein [Acidobacteriota bacterium]
MQAWQLDRLGGELRLRDVPMPHVRPGSVLVRIEASALMSYLESYVEGRLPGYRPPSGAFTPGGNGVGVIHSVGRDVWHLKPGQRVLLSSHFVAAENVPEPAQILIGITSFGPESEAIQADWRNGTLAEFALMPAAAVTPADGFVDFDSAQLAVLSRCVIPFGGLLRGRLAAGETLIVNGATGAYGSAAVLVALAMGAGRVIAAGRNAAALEAIAHAGFGRVTPVQLTGDVHANTAALRAASDGGAQIAFDMVGQATDPNATLAALNSLRRGGRLVLMGSMTTALPVPYMQLMFNNLEIIGNFMYPAGAYRRLLELLGTGRLDVQRIVPRIFPLAALPEAMEAASTAKSLECVVVKP